MSNTVSNIERIIDSDNPEVQYQIKLILNNLYRRLVLKKVTADYTILSLKKMSKIIEDLIKEREEQLVEQQRQKSKKEKQVLGLLKQMQEQGLTIDDITSILGTSNVENALANYNYVYEDVNGITRYWSGKGKTPVYLAEVMKRDGTTKEDYKRKVD